MSAGRKQYRCAVYTRKSSEEGLEQDFNSLQAQREACEAYIASQKHEGWKLVPTAFDDGGISGGTMERPGLKRLLADIQSGQIDIIVVYKVDRLTRSLADFAKMVEVFDAHGVSFVAVTQQFNTTTSMGRLTLNVLLSFAQFEREVTGERIRDKIDASKKKGMWMGGSIPLGYRVEDRKLKVVEAEAELVRIAYRRYLELDSIDDLIRELRREFPVAPVRAPKPEGSESPAPRLLWSGRGSIYYLLRNPIYVGEVPHKGNLYPGQHEAIIDRELWDRVQAKLIGGSAKRRGSKRKTASSALIGKILDEQGNALTPSHANKRGQRYRYYVTHQNHRPEHAQDSGWRLQAEEFERQIKTSVQTLLDDRPAIVSAAMEAGIDQVRINDLLKAINASPSNSALDLVERVELGEGRVRLTIKLPGNTDLSITRDFPMLMKRRGVEMRLVVPGANPAREPDRTLIKAISRAMGWWEQLQSGQFETVKDLSQSDGTEEGYIRRVLPLAFLSPDIVEMILAEKQPIELTTERLTRAKTVPLAWSEQRSYLGIGR